MSAGTAERNRKRLLFAGKSTKRKSASEQKLHRIVQLRNNPPTVSRPLEKKFRSSVPSSTGKDWHDMRYDVVSHPPYQPKYGPTEYIICQLVNHLKINTQRELVDLVDLEQQIYRAAGAIGPFDGTFAHCGYSEDGTYPDVVIPDPPQVPQW